MNTIERARQTRKKASEFPQGLLDLLDSYVHGGIDRLTEGGVALGMFDRSSYTAGETVLAPGDVLVFYSDGITEAESREGVPFDDAGLIDVIERHWWEDAATIGTAIVSAVQAHAVETRLADDLTVLAIRRPLPLPEAPTPAP